MRFKKAILPFLLLISSHAVFAHALWIETNPTGTKDKTHEIKIFFGEFADKDISAADKWFSDLKDFGLLVITPDGKEIKLSSIKKADHYLAQFTPNKDGIYTLVMHHTAKDTYGTMKLDYNSSATVVVGNQFNGKDVMFDKNAINLVSGEAHTASTNKTLLVKSIYDGKPAVEKEIKVFAPNGWGKILYSNEKGEIKFTPLWPGKYMVEFAYTDKTSGEHHGKKYEEVWKVATYIILVK